jgi:hypothetical protein
MAFNDLVLACLAGPFCWHSVRPPETRIAVMLSAIDLLAKLLDRDRVAALSERVAGRSRMGVWQRTMERLPLLGPTEARGYLRARGMGVVREETSRLIEQEGAAAARHRSEIEEAAIQLLVDLISAQVAQARSSGGWRKAA